MTAGLAVELMVSLLQSPLKQSHPASQVAKNSQSSADEETLPYIPHQIRGFLSNYSQMAITVSNIPLYITTYFSEILLMII